MIFKVGDKVKLEGVLIQSSNDNYPLILRIDDGSELSFTIDGRYFTKGQPIIQLVERPKTKVKKYRVLYYASVSNCIDISSAYYKNAEDFTSQSNIHCKFMQLLESTEKEFEE